MQPDPEAVLTSREAMKFLRIGRTSLYWLTKEAAFQAYRIGSGRTSDLRYLKSELLAWLRSRRIGALPEDKPKIVDHNPVTRVATHDRPLQPCPSHTVFEAGCADCAMMIVPTRGE